MGFFGSKPKINNAQKKAAERAKAGTDVVICLRGVIKAITHRKYGEAEKLTKELVRRIRILRRVS